MGVIIILAVIMTISIASSVDNFYSVISSQLLLACFTHTCMSCIADKIRDHRAMVRPCEELAFSFEADHFWPAKMARLAVVCAGQNWPAQSPNRRRHATLL